MKALYIALNDIRIAFSDRSIWINLLVIPAALIFVIGLANGQSLAAPAPRRAIWSMWSIRISPRCRPRSSTRWSASSRRW
ncbi:MAG: hypothetical protein HND48_13455 [Chloroflexi bacterium]|nr:hypothetical protein [Chloroflexota bacterium]